MRPPLKLALASAATQTNPWKDEEVTPVIRSYSPSLAFVRRLMAGAEPEQIARMQTALEEACEDREAATNLRAWEGRPGLVLDFETERPTGWGGALGHPHVRWNVGDGVLALAEALRQMGRPF